MLRIKRRARPAEPPVGRRRPLLMLLVMLVCGAGFWYNFERRFADIEAEHALLDATGRLTPEERQRIMALRQTMRDLWGLGIRIRILHAPGPPESAPNGSTVLIRLAPPGPGEVPAAPAPATPAPGTSAPLSAASPAPPAPWAEIQLPPLVDKAMRPAGTTASASSRLEARLRLCLIDTPVGACVQDTLLRLLTALDDRPRTTPASSAADTSASPPDSPPAPPADTASASPAGASSAPGTVRAPLSPAAP